jgi:hypothetical protein
VFAEKQLGHQMINNQLINTFIPILFAYGQLIKDDNLKEKAVSWMEQVGAEKNQLIAHWTKYGVHCRHAGESQALIELNQHYCTPRKCLECTIGAKILKQGYCQ